MSGPSNSGGSNSFDYNPTMSDGKKYSDIYGAVNTRPSDDIMGNESAFRQWAQQLQDTVTNNTKSYNQKWTGTESGNATVVQTAMTLQGRNATILTPQVNPNSVL